MQSAGQTFDLGRVGFRFLHQQGSSLPIERVSGIGVQQQLWEEGLKNIEKICAASMHRSGVWEGCGTSRG